MFSLPDTFKSDFHAREIILAASGVMAFQNFRSEWRASDKNGYGNVVGQCDRQQFSLLYPFPWRGAPQLHAKEPPPLPHPVHALASVGVDFTFSFSGGHVTPANQSILPS